MPEDQTDDGEQLEFDWGEGANDVIVAACDLENPESCESCQ